MHMMEYCTTLTRKEFLTCTATGMALEDIVLSGTVSQSQKGRYYTILLI